MSQLVPVAELVLNNADSDGVITYHGFAYNWEFHDEPDSPDEPVWEHHNTQVLSGINGVSPKAYVSWEDMVGAQWLVEHGEAAHWGVTSLKGGRGKVSYIQYKYSGADPEPRGQVCSALTYSPSLYFRFFRFNPPEDIQGPAYVEIQFLGEGHYDQEDDNYYEYSIVLPWQSREEEDYAYDTPYLGRRPCGSTEDWSVISEYRGGGGLQSVEGMEASWQELQVEMIGNGVEGDPHWLRIVLSRTGRPWLFEVTDKPLIRGFVRVIFRRQAGMFAMYPLKFPWLSWCRPKEYLTMTDWMSATADGPDYLTLIHDLPTGTSAGTTGEVDSQNSRAYRPILVFRNDNIYARPVVYAIHQSEPAVLEIDLARDEVTDTSDTGRLLSCTWNRNNRYRGASFTAVLRDPSAYSFKGNEKAWIDLAWDDGAGATVETKLTGYIVPQKPLEPGATADEHRLEIRAVDGVEARISKKFMLHMPCFERWAIGDAFEYVMKRCGIRDSMIDVASAITSDYKLPRAEPPWERIWQYADDHSVISALDEMVDHFGFRWGVAYDGTYCLAKEVAWVSGATPDFVLNQDTTTDADVVNRLEPERSPEDFRNYVAAVDRDARLHIALSRDVDSHRTTTDDKFIGDDWWEVIIADSHLLQQAQNKLKELGRFRDVITWTTRRIDLGPDSFVSVEVEDIDVSSGDIYRITEEHGEATMDPPDMTVTYTMVAEEYV